MISKGKARQITIKDVAREAGVHASTVSRVLNPATRSMVSKELTEIVMKTASALGYRRNPLAAGLRTRRSHTVGVMIPDLTNPLFPPIVRGIERTLAGHGLIAILADSANNLQSELAILDNMLARQIEGLIIATAHREDPVVARCVEEQVPVVLVNRTVDDSRVAAVVNDDAHGIRLAFDHVVGLGHKRIAHIAGPQDTSTGSTRCKAFVDAARSAGFPACADLVVSAESFTERAGRAALASLLSHGKQFTAVVAANDMLALGCYDALAAAGLTCPDDVSVTGFNDMPFVDRLSPPLTTVHVPHDELGVRAAECLLQRIRGEESDAADNGPATRILLTPTLVVRGSVRQVRAGQDSVKPRSSSYPARAAT
jgi:LacI family transcriptional regulator